MTGRTPRCPGGKGALAEEVAVGQPGALKDPVCCVHDSIWRAGEECVQTRPDAEQALLPDLTDANAGEKLVIFQTTDWPEASNASQLLADTLRKIGVNAELAPMSFGEFTTRRQNKGPVENGGWNIFISSYSGSNPLTTPFMLANGEAAWWGWPKSDEYEAVRAKWADVETLEERKALARKMQEVWWDFVGGVLLGRVVLPTAHRKALTGLIEVSGGGFPMWNMQKV